MKRVFLLGAGFSVPAGFPQMGELFNELRKFYDTYISGKPHIFLENAIDDFDIYDIGVFGEEKNFEKFISLLDIGIQENKVFKSNFIKIKKAWICLLALFLHNKLFQLKNEEFYKSFFSKFNPKSDIIISFNWDNLVEHILNNMGIKWRYANDFHSQDESLVLYKLHGSINWFSINSFWFITINKSVNNLKPLDNDKYWSTMQELNKILDLSNLKEIIEPFIIAPTYLKKYKDSGLSSLWESAEMKLADANEIVIIGYSFPELDFYSELMLRTLLFFRWAVKLMKSNGKHKNINIEILIRNAGSLKDDLKIKIIDKDCNVIKKIRTIAEIRKVDFIPYEGDCLEIPIDNIFSS